MSTLTKLLFEDPGPLVILFIAVGVILRIVSHRGSDRRMARISVASLIAAIVVSVIAWLVTTDREAIMDHTEQLVAAAGPIDTAALQRLIAPNAAMLDDRGNLITTADVQTIALNLETRNVATNSVRSLSAVDEGRGAGKSHLSVSTQIENEHFANYPQRTRWSIEWRQEPDGTWRAVTFQWLEWNGQPPPTGFIQ